MTNAIEELKAMRDVWKGFKFNPLDGLHTLRLNEYAVKNTINILDEAIVSLEQKERLKEEVTYQLDQIIYTDKIKEDIRRSVWKEVLELMK